MQENKIIKLIFKFSSILLTIGILFYILNYAGFFNFYYRNKFKQMSKNLHKIFMDFLNKDTEITRAIASDPIIKGAILQYNLGENILPALKVMNMYKENYREIKNIAIFDYNYRIITSDIENISSFRKISDDWFIFAQTKNLYISPVYYNRNINSYIISIMLPIKNVVEEVMGFVKTEVSIAPLLNKFKKFANINIIIIDITENRINFIYPLDVELHLKEPSLEFDIKPENKITEIKIPGFKLAYANKIKNSSIILITVPSSKFFSFPLYLKILLFFLLLISILSYIYLWIDKKQKIIAERKEKFKGLMDEIVETTQKTEKYDIELLENLPQKTSGAEASAIDERSDKKEDESVKHRKEKVSIPDKFELIEDS